MKKCGNCGYEKNKDDKKFCIKCGKPLVHTVENESTVLPFDPIEDEDAATPVAEETAVEEKAVAAKIVCSNCGYEKNKDGRKFCIKCGKPLAYTEVKEAVILPFEPIPDEELVSVHTEESITENPVAAPTKELSKETIAEETVVAPIEELPKKKQNTYLKYVIALIGVLLILGVLIIALIPDREEASELNNAKITTASETTYELTSAETTVTTEQPATVSETTSVTTIPITATETITTVPVTTTVPETTTTAETTAESVTTTAETTTVPVTTTTVVTTVPKTEASTVKTTVTTTKKETSSAKRELLTPLDKVPTYTRYKMKNGAFYDEFDYEFIYDEDVIGEWNLVSVYDGDPSEFDFDKAVPFEEETHIWGKKLFFCSNSVVYSYRFPYKGIESLNRQWTLGLICEGMDKTQPIVHEYEVWKIDGREYLLVKENSYATLNYDNGKAFSYLNYLIYEKINSNEPIIENDALEIITAIAPVINADDGIERELLTPYDKVLAYERYKINNIGGISERIKPYFFISDEIALGEWNAIDYISSEPSEYIPNTTYTTEYSLAIVFEDKGKFTWKWDKYKSEKSKWTLGLIIAPHGAGGNYVRPYQIWKIDGEEYLFCEEADGVCYSTGTKFYYVFKKVE